MYERENSTKEIDIFCLICINFSIIPTPPLQDDSARFHYFVIDNSLIVALLEKSFSPPPPPPSASAPGAEGSGGGVAPPSAARLPTLTAILRSPTGRHVWSMQLRHNPRSEEVSV
jgi:hypothetical protein